MESRWEDLPAMAGQPGMFLFSGKDPQRDLYYAVPQTDTGVLVE